MRKFTPERRAQCSNTECPIPADQREFYDGRTGRLTQWCKICHRARQKVLRAAAKREAETAEMPADLQAARLPFNLMRFTK
jgi:hypothetical protein